MTSHQNIKRHPHNLVTVILILTVISASEATSSNPSSVGQPITPSSSSKASGISSMLHDATLSGSIDYKRDIKVAELTYNADGTIQIIDP